MREALVMAGDINLYLSMSRVTRLWSTRADPTCMRNRYCMMCVTPVQCFGREFTHVVLD